MDSTDGCACECTDSFTGKNCGVPPPCTPALDCGGHGTTEDKDKTDGCVCDCFDNYTGKDCSEFPPCDASIKAKYSVNGHSYQDRVLQSGALIWNDRSYTATVPPELDGAIFFVQPHKTINSGTWHLSGVPVGSRVFVSYELHHSNRNGGFSLDSTWSHLTDSTTWLFKNQVQTLRIYQKVATTPDMSLPISSTWVGFVAYFPPGQVQLEVLKGRTEP
jgi:hypothetical protein